ncbi:glycine betaine ABC transporter substrate-binding protein [Natranaerobius trueperi]|uniref:Glycine/betaine ABC transporter n=1 Tax=Natranaerobius trueperi TaxID=759412 RepID=A0A226BXU7_9FIRM|nr:glycine betaine ABC transporter substrate-binding protein [Natranaerobius trueperi]OWZ82960.1 glycine/betaine ABC transporter [Natranaerobius trueperi]
MKKLLVIVLSMLLVGSFVVGCGDGEETVNGGDEEVQTVELAHMDWACSIASTHLASVVLEEEMGYEVDLIQADAGPVYQDIVSGDQDAFVSAWLPVTHGSYYEEHHEDFDELGPIYENARIGLVVPEYMEVDSIDELNDSPYGDDLGWEITGIDEGAGVMERTTEAIDEYGLDFDLLPSSDAAMTVNLEDAYESEEPVIVTGWTPHWKFSEWDLKFLEDPKGVYGEAETLDGIAREGLEEDLPEVHQFLSNFYVDDDQLGEIMGMIADGEDEYEAARIWMEDNMDVVEDWIPEQ